MGPAAEAAAARCPGWASGPGAGWASKLWPTERFAETGARLHRERGMVPLVVWGPKEEPLRDAIARDLERDGIPFVVATGYGAAGLPPRHRQVPVLPKPYDPADLTATLERICPPRA